MNKDEKIKVFLVDDDAVFAKLMEIELRNYPDFCIEIYPSGELCMKNIEQHPDVIIVDYHLNGIDKNAMNGLELLRKIKDFKPDIQVIILSQQDAIEIAIDAIQHKAIDYVVKSETAFLRIQNTLKTIRNFKKMERGLS